MDEPVLDQCRAYSRGELSREELVDWLSAYDYAPQGETDGYDWLTVDPPGTWFEVTMAHHFGLIDDSIYDEVFYRRHPEARDVL